MLTAAENKQFQASTLSVVSKNLPPFSTCELARIYFSIPSFHHLEQFLLQEYQILWNYPCTNVMTESLEKQTLLEIIHPCHQTEKKAMAVQKVTILNCR